MPIKFPREVILEYITKYITEDINEEYDPWININSVFTSDKKYKLGFNPEENRVYDFKLGQGWTIPGFIKQYDETMRSETEAQELLLRILIKQKKNGIKLTYNNKPKIVLPIDLPEIHNLPNMKNLSDEKVLRNKIGRNAIRLIMHKNLGLEHVKKYNLMYVDEPKCWNCNGTGKVDGNDCPVCDHSLGRNPYYNFLIIPTYENGKLVYFQARNTDRSSDFRYRNPPIPRSQVVYFYDLLKKNDRIFITEGPFDAMTLFDYSATCIMGNRISDPQAEKIVRLNPKEIIFIPDYDHDEKTRSIIFKNVKKNIDRIKFHMQEKIQFGVYEWYKKYSKELENGKKDINDIGKNEIDEDYINYGFI